ncbi:hypothetical protein BC567DRAFT_18965 [Phyllosticta citribraziliensis]
MEERTGFRVFYLLWSYVKIIMKSKVYVFFVGRELMPAACGLRNVVRLEMSVAQKFFRIRHSGCRKK